MTKATGTRDPQLSPSEAESVELARSSAVSQLLARRAAHGHWEGRLSSSALSTATACIALRLHAREVGGGDSSLVRGAIEWLALHQNADGGWGDTTDSPSNLSTTVLVWVALGLAPDFVGGESEVIGRCEAWMRERVGELTPPRIARAVQEVYGADKTFAVPILVTCALGGRFGEGAAAWRRIPFLPFELAALPHQVFHRLGLPMVSYAMPALIAIGQVIERHKRTLNPLSLVAGVARRAARGRTLRVLESIQPSTGGFLEATPLTSFVCASLVGCGLGRHPVAERGLRFLRESARVDGSWPIDTNLATWLTSLSVDALGGAGQLGVYLEPADRGRIADWLRGQQLEDEHPYTHAAPGGWAWTDLAGGVPDADDTPAALVALGLLGSSDPDSARAGVGWLVGLQNRDGGIPTFCRGWGKLPFDRSSADLTAHALRAFAACETRLDAATRHDAERARDAAAAYLVDAQRSDGAWVPLWFGNQLCASQENPLYGTSRVVKAAGCHEGSVWSAALVRGVRWMLGIQHEDGGFGGDAGLRPSIEETGLALDGLASAALTSELPAELAQEVRAAVACGSAWLARATEGGERFDATPIGLYFAKLWYSEELYPLIFAVAGLERAARLLES